MSPSPAPALPHARILSVALNLPGPAALARCRDWGAACTKLEPPAPQGMASADPMARYCPRAYAELHEGIRVVRADLKSPAGQALLHAELAATDVLITSFRPSALRKLGLEWSALQARHPALSLVRIVGAPGAGAEEPGHDLTYQAAAGLLPAGTTLPATLHADMAGALQASEAVLRALLARQATGAGSLQEVALAEAAHWLARPRAWGLTQPSGDVGGAHAGYRVYACADGRAAVAALEPYFMARLCAAAGLPADADPRAAPTHSGIAAFFQPRRRADLEAWALREDLPVHLLD
ncbi:CoA transferase [Paracidovorax anthurii]|uniref:Crotonobetainyl-CoA:carnitine CoA-transferase CaiB-like acyl-CoA transferase n=1 Tax=Paracidovorax anthurii TaxID=78229 RepID=A0A328ZIF0_9BURK|nr:CoA transferase [Paracidovorax anthurii]RAR82577.1 crotonobetainyl-CoA:carnitine CoA-transferase CaiB-like acyl-CoA transferase [Paracidovorax anthurii]